MKRITAIASIFILIIIFQKGYSQKLRFSVVGAPQLSWLKPDIINVKSSGVKLGVKYGLNMEKYFQENYAFVTGLYINNSGGYLTYNDTVFFQISDTYDTISTDNRVKYNMQYLEMPIALKFTTNRIGYFKYFAQIGVNGMVKLKANGTIENSIYEDSKINDEVSLFNAGYHIGGGMQYSFGGNASAIVSLIFTNGFIDVTPTPGADALHQRLDDKVVMNSLTLKLGILF